MWEVIALLVLDLIARESRLQDSLSFSMFEIWCRKQSIAAHESGQLTSRTFQIDLMRTVA